MKIIGKTIMLLFILALYSIRVDAQSAVAISSNPGPDLYIALNWSPVKNAVKYNVYRRNETDTKYPSVALNTSPIQVQTDCAVIKSLLITSLDSTDWKLVSRGLSEKNKLFNPCKLNTILPSTEKYNRLKALAKTSIPIAIVAGWGYKDKTVTAGKVYYYKIVALNASGTLVETVAIDLRVTAGTVETLPATSAFGVEAGDDAILLTWNNVPGAAGYIVERAPTATGVFDRVNESKYSSDITKKLNGDTIVPSLKGMLDFQRFSLKTGKDTTHLVNSTVISGPANGSSYYYRVKAVDLFNRPGTVSIIAGPAKPLDKTSPSVTIDLAATPDNILGQVNIRWSQVVKDINGHWERPYNQVRYKLYRLSSSENPDSIPSVYLGEVPTITGMHSRDYNDTDPNLRSEFGNKTWWYRIKSKDVVGNISQWSSAVSAIVKDNTPPRIPKNVTTKGFEDYISVKWKPNTEPDIASYMIYRSLCHLGSWVECLPQDTCKVWVSYNPYGTASGSYAKTMSMSSYNAENKNRLPCPCSGPFVFLGEITQDSVQRAVSSGHFFFDDHTIPAGSPLCYAYWIKAKDISGNLSGSFPIPSAAERAEIQCERLHDLTPPDPAFISGLFAEAEQIRIEWMGPPSQDTRAYHVYRAEGKDPSQEPPVSEYKWVGGMTVELPPTKPVVLHDPYKAPDMATCDKISVQAAPWMSQGFFEDKTVKPKLTYWYRVVGIDYDGNETPVDKAVAISTFSFSRKTPNPPVLNPPIWQAEPCGIALTWSPAFNSALHKGFIVYKNVQADGSYIPIVVSPVTSNSFTDNNVVKGQTYWYKVAVLMQNGRLSPLSSVQSITP